MGNFNELLVWQKSVDFAVEVYEETKRFPRDEVYGLRAQLRAAASSIPSNLAEGQGRSTSPDYRRFVLHARGSAFEVQTQLILCSRLGYLSPEITKNLQMSIDEIARMLNGLLAYLTPKA